MNKSDRTCRRKETNRTVRGHEERAGHACLICTTNMQRENKVREKAGNRKILEHKNLKVGMMVIDVHFLRTVFNLYAHK